mmetsp:Transcript_22942/g.58841  ORF Transcript_22942/g.58841 Transcript_22942/m.58841 type:complete len:97 (+) Transcript_22942:92-382(+)
MPLPPLYGVTMRVFEPRARDSVTLGAEQRCRTSDEDAEAEAALAADLAAAQGEPAAPAAEVPPEAEAATGGLPADVALALRAVTSVVEAIKGEMQA